jgi:hypothetical protein
LVEVDTTRRQATKDTKSGIQSHAFGLGPSSQRIVGYVDGTVEFYDGEVDSPGNRSAIQREGSSLAGLLLGTKLQVLSWAGLSTWDLNTGVRSAYQPLTQAASANQLQWRDQPYIAFSQSRHVLRGGHDGKLWQRLECKPNEFAFAGGSGYFCTATSERTITITDGGSGARLVLNLPGLGKLGQLDGASLSPDARFGLLHAEGGIFLFGPDGKSTTVMKVADTGVARLVDPVSSTQVMVCEPNGNATYSTCRVWDGARLNDPASRFQINGLVTAIGSDQNHYLIGTLGGQIHRLDRGFTTLRSTNTNSQVNALVSGGSGSSHFVAIGNDRSATVIDRESGEVIVKLHDFGTEGYIALLPEGFFATNSFDLSKKMTGVHSGNVFSVDQFWDVFYRPDLLKARLSRDRTYAHRLVGALTFQAALQKPPPSVSMAEPPTTVSQDRLKLRYQVLSGGGGVGEVQVFHNGKLIKSDGYYKDAPGSTMVALNTTKATSNAEVAKGMRKMLGAGETTASAVSTVGNRDSVVVRQAKPKTLNAAGEFSDSVEIDVIPGEDNEITVMARNQDNTILGQGQTVRFKSSLPKADPHLWILPVGIASFQDSGVRKLASPKKDALDFACSYGGKEALKSAGISCDKPGYASSLFKSSNIHVVDPLTNEKATRANILAKLDEIAAKAKPTDTFIWFVSSHGTMDANSVYGIVPFDAKCQDPKCDAASGWSAPTTSWRRASPSRP